MGAEAVKPVGPEPPDEPQIAHMLWAENISCEVPKYNALIHELPPPPWWWTLWYHVRRLALWPFRGRP